MNIYLTTESAETERGMGEVQPPVLPLHTSSSFHDDFGSRFQDCWDIPESTGELSVSSDFLWKFFALFLKTIFRICRK